MIASHTMNKLEGLEKDQKHDFRVDSLMQQYNDGNKPSILIVGAPTIKKNLLKETDLWSE